MRDAELEIHRLLGSADRQALEIIQAQRADAEKLAQALLEKETLMREEVLELLRIDLPTAAPA